MVWTELCSAFTTQASPKKELFVLSEFSLCCELRCGKSLGLENFLLKFLDLTQILIQAYPTRGLWEAT